MKTKEIAELLGGELLGDRSVEIESVAALSTGTNGAIAFLDRADSEFVTSASCVIVPLSFSGDSSVTVIKVRNPKLAFARISALLHKPKELPESRHITADVSQTAIIGNGVFLDAFTGVGERSKIGDGSQLRVGSSIGDNVTIGKNCVLNTNVRVQDGCTIGNNVVLHPGVVIGADGFGYVADESGNHIKFPQIGTVVVEDNVEIGANSCVDRGALGETRIGEGTKIDNLVQIAHNVQIGKRVVIAAQTGISGSSIIEDDCVIGGQVGIGDHARVLSGAIIGSQAGILPGKIVRPGVWWGTPIQPLDEYKRQHAHVKGIARLKDELKRLLERISKLESQ